MASGSSSPLGKVVDRLLDAVEGERHDEGTALARRIDFSALEAVDPSVAPALYKALNELAVGRQRESSW